LLHFLAAAAVPTLARFRQAIRRCGLSSMTPRALARFQSFPDWYELPERNALACKIIGNAVPPLLMRRVMEAQCSSF
jgi:DNA (cytosine-5)-methyltransferase 1